MADRQAANARSLVVNGCISYLVTCASPCPLQSEMSRLKSLALTICGWQREFPLILATCTWASWSWSWLEMRADASSVGIAEVRCATALAH